MTWHQFYTQILARFDAIDAQLTDFQSRLVTLADRTEKMADDLDGIGEEVDGIRDSVDNLTVSVNELGGFDQAAYALDEIAEDIRRKEHAEWRDGARAAMKGLAS